MKFSLAQPQFIYELGKRNNQEDSIYPSSGNATADDRLFIVCDGMGGHEHGEQASRIVTESFAKYVREHVDDETVFDNEMFEEALEMAYQALDEADDNRGSKKMGTTLTFILFHKGGCFMAHIGDSRIYHVRPSEKRFLYMSRDHSLVFELFRSGEISYEEMKTHPKKNIITRAMMPGEDNRISAETVNTTDVQPGDYFYLCSDGMLERTEESDIMGILASDNTDTAKQQRLISTALDNKDNHSAYIIRVEKVEQEEGDDQMRNDETTSRANVVNYIPELNKQAVTKVAEGDFVSDGPVKEKVKKKFPWVKVMLVLIAAAAYFLFYYIPKQRDMNVSHWEKNQEKSTIKDTLTNYNNPDEKAYGAEKRDSVNNSSKSTAASQQSDNKNRKSNNDWQANGKKNDKRNSSQSQNKQKQQQKQQPKPQPKTESQPAGNGGGAAPAEKPAANPTPAPTPAPAAQPTPTPAAPPTNNGGIDAAFE